MLPTVLAVHGGSAAADAGESIRHGNQGVMDTASKGQLEDEFGTSKDEEVVKQILEKGTIIEKTVSNDT